MSVVDGFAQDRFRNEQIRSIKKALEREYAPRIAAALTREEKKAWKTERDAEIEREVRPLLREASGVFPRSGFCSECGYDLTGNTSGVCPECGTKIES